LLKTLEGDCYKKVYAKYVRNSETEYTIEFIAEQKTTFICEDIYLVGTMAEIHGVLLYKKYHKLHVKNLTPL